MICFFLHLPDQYPNSIIKYCKCSQGQNEFSNIQRNISGSWETMMVRSLLHEAMQLLSPIVTWVTVPVCPPSLWAILRVAVSQIYTHRSIDPHATQSPSRDQLPLIKLFSAPWLCPLMVLVNLYVFWSPDLASHILKVSSKEFDIKYVPSCEISNELMVS